MQEIYHHENTYIVRFDRGEDVLKLLQKFCADNTNHAGSFWGIGAAKGVTLAEYDLEKKEYRSKNLEDMLEIASLSGNIAVANNNVVLHAHGVFATLEQTYAGHVMKLIVGVTCEITLTVFPGEVRRELNEEIGLRLLN